MKTGNGNGETGKDNVETGKHNVMTGKDNAETRKYNVNTRNDSLESWKDNIKTDEDNAKISISIIIPVAPNEQITENFINKLKFQTEKSEVAEVAEVLFVSSDEIKMDLSPADIRDLHFKFIRAASGRANCMNAGAKAVQDKDTYLFFVHVDTIFQENSISRLQNTIKKHPDSFMYFDLVFYDGHPLMKLNELGVWFRTRFLKTPFGDQCFCIRKDIFEGLGGYPVNVECGEDHMLVRRVRENNIKIIPVKAKVKTSARKYTKNGWGKTTLLHLFLWRKQIHEDKKKNSGVEIT